ncbi:DUF4440 domain-containing protein [Rhodanobacter sp. B04]|uniref:nuclear transport factor 2 family protein n=1 Tax=Rhodanobacter sp. B04 TaxID=1945860 RepID=UPI000987CEC6|nr:DUF4440 domain-containing protein [Rhodanobacter sp. B04]OOG63912.1 DUF4440 domain-containing protein [Rhodanobacter sp. B04]
MTAETEPDLSTAPELLGVQEELRRREPIFHRPEVGSTRADFERMTEVDFWEVGASGRRYSRSYVLDVLDARRDSPEPDVWETSGFHCRQLATDLYLLTYTLRQGSRLTRRSTIWRQVSGGWKIVFHQGTEVVGA